MVTLRPTRPDDIGFLGLVLAIAADWHSTTAPTPDDPILAEPGVARYLEGWPRHGDVGVIAVENGSPLGAAWWRYFADDDRGYGFVASDIPELTIGVVHHARGRGIGGALLAYLIAEARGRSIGHLSLSVATDNPARRLYERFGFGAAGEAGDSVTMLLAIG